MLSFTSLHSLSLKRDCAAMPELLRSAELALKKNGQDIQQLKKLADIIIGSLVENLGKVSPGVKKGTTGVQLRAENPCYISYLRTIHQRQVLRRSRKQQWQQAS